MIQFKEKGRDQPSTRASLYTYPALMAADILLYRPQQVPVGADQRQHVELARDLATRFNNTYGPVFTVPEITVPTAGARVMRLDEPTRKMGKSGDGPGIVRLLDPPDAVRRKVARAVTDSDTGPDAVRRDHAKPGVTNLLDMVAELEPLQKRYADLAADPAYVAGVYAAGDERCREVTSPVLAAAQAAMGL
jgi:tryptophanyl-tRNA synthetase